MFRFPFGTTQELNLDWFLEQWEVFKQEAQTALDGIDHALDAEIQRVEDAMADLYAARDAAIAAKNDALSYAQSANTSAIGASQSAQNSAASAVTSAQQAQSAAQSATSAQSSATNAGTSAGNALTQAQQSEAWATGEIGGVHVPPSAPQNQSNAKQYATNAQLSANAANTAKNDARVYSQDSKAWATGIRDGEPVTSEDETYQNNAKYYAESISGDAAAAAQSASEAAASAASVGQSAAQIAQNAADIEDLNGSVGVIEKTVGLESVDIELGIISASDGQLAYTDSVYSARTPETLTLAVNSGDKIFIDKTNLPNISAVTIFDKTTSTRIASNISLADGYTFQNSYTNIAFTFSAYSTLANSNLSVVYISKNEGGILYYNNKITELEGNDEAAASVIFNKSNYKTNFYDYTVESGYYKASDGDFVENSGWKSYVISLSDTLTFRVHSWAYGTATYSYFIKDANGNVLDNGDRGTNPATEWDSVITIPESINATQLIIVSGSSQSVNIYTFGEFSEPSNKKYIAFGDSVCRGNHQDGTKSDYAYPEAFGNWKKITVNNLAIGGQGYKTTRYTVAAIDTISATNIADANLITLSYGINDASDTDLDIGTENDTTNATILGCVYQCINYIYTQNPKVQLVICGTTKQGGNWNTRLAQVNAGLKAICEKYGVAFIDMSESPINQFNGISGGALTSDGTHFNDDGYKLLSQFMTGQLGKYFGS